MRVVDSGIPTLEIKKKKKLHGVNNIWLARKIQELE